MSILSQGLKKAERGISKVIPHAHSAETRANMYAAREQMNLYQEQKQQLHTAAEAASQQKDAERQKIHQKQIRALRSGYSKRSGLMSSASNEPSDKLG